MLIVATAPRQPICRNHHKCAGFTGTGRHNRDCQTALFPEYTKLEACGGESQGATLCPAACCSNEIPDGLE